MIEHAHIWIRSFAVSLLAFVALCGTASRAGELTTDANIVTGIDISDSITPEDARLEIEGMAQAIRSPQILAAIRHGRNGRIGFAVFAWHHNQFPEVVLWRLIASQEDAQAVAEEIEARLRVDLNFEARAKEPFYIGRLTDLSQAIDHAADMLRQAPFATEHTIVNIIGNGEDNVGEDAHVARDRVVETGAVVNGVVLGNDPSMLDYYRREVVGGPGAFVLSTATPARMAEVLRRKFLYDIALAGPHAGPATRIAGRPGDGTAPQTQRLAFRDSAN